MPLLSPDRESRRFWDDTSKTCLPISARIIKQTFWDRVVWIIFSCLFSSEGCTRTGSSALHLPVDPVFQRMRGVALFCRRCGEGQTSPAACSTHNKEAWDIWHQQVQESGRTGRQGMICFLWADSPNWTMVFWYHNFLYHHLTFYNLVAFLLIFVSPFSCVV